MFSERAAHRLRLLVVAGLVAPVAMVLIGQAIAWWARGELLWPGRWPDLRALGLGAMTALVSIGFVAVLYRTNKHLEQALRRSGMKVGTEALKIAGYPVMLVIVTAAAVGEEVLFRGGLQPSVGVVVAALLFGFSHGGWRREMWAYVLAAAISGAMFGVMYKLTGDLWVPVVAHALHNILSTAFMGKKIDISRNGFWPTVRLVPDEDDDEEAGDVEDAADVEAVAEPLVGPPLPEEEVTADESVDKPVPAPDDGEGDGPDDGDPPRRPAE